MTNLNKDERITLLQIEATDMAYLQKSLLCSNYALRQHLALIEGGKEDIQSLFLDLCQTLQNLEQVDSHLDKGISKIKKTIKQIQQLDLRTKRPVL